MEITKTERNIAALAVVIVLISGGILFINDKNGGTLDLSNTDVRIVVSGSMDGEPRDQYDIPTIPVGSMVFIQKVPTDDQNGFYDSLKIGDVLTFNYIHPLSHENMVVTHRIISISGLDGDYTYTLKGDSIADDPTNGSVQVVTSSSGDIIGKVVGVSPTLGSLVVFLSTTTGKVCLIIIPCLVLVTSEVRNIIGIVRGKNLQIQEEPPQETPVKIEFTSEVQPQDPSDDIFVRR